jgi:hypothetical protein
MSLRVVFANVINLVLAEMPAAVNVHGALGVADCVSCAVAGFTK